jgi:hypothetical protein
VGKIERIDESEQTVFWISSAKILMGTLRHYVYRENPVPDFFFFY